MDKLHCPRPTCGNGAFPYNCGVGKAITGFSYKHTCTISTGENTPNSGRKYVITYQQRTTQSVCYKSKRHLLAKKFATDLPVARANIVAYYVPLLPRDSTNLGLANEILRLYC